MNKNSDETANDKPDNDKFIIDALSSGGLTPEIIESWRQLEMRRKRPLPESVMRLRKLVPSGVILSDEELAAFSISREYMNATMIPTVRQYKKEVLRPEDTAGLPIDELWDCAYGLAIEELNYYSRTKLLRRQKWLTALVGVWILGGATAEAAFDAIYNSQPFWASVNILLLLLFPVCTIVWWFISKLLCQEYIKTLKERVNTTAGHKGRDSE